MGKISDRLGDQLKPGSSQQITVTESEDEDSLLDYPIHYSEGREGSWTTLNFSEPARDKGLIPDYTADRIYSDDEEVWRVRSEEIVKVNVEPGIESKDKLAEELKNAYEEVLN